MIIDFYKLQNGGGGDDPAVLAALNAVLGVEYATVAEALAALVPAATLEVGATTVETGPGTTANYASNDNVKIYGDDGNLYTLAEWNALFVSAGYDKDAMAVAPLGYVVNAFDSENDVLYFDSFTGVTYTVSGETAGGAGQLSHSVYNENIRSAAATGTDSTTGKGWAVTDGGDDWVYTEANTGGEWRIPKTVVYMNAHVANKDLGPAYTDALVSIAEWCRRRMAIDSGLTTTEADGTIEEVQILNASGAQAAVGEDMYFWIDGTNTNILAKYNKNNISGQVATLLTDTIRDAIYAKQVANGINMNDTGVNSASKPVLAPGCRGSEAIAVSGKWYIVTPFISNANATTSGANTNVPDAPAAYWAKSKGFALPTDRRVYADYLNKPIVSALFTYMNTVEGRGLPAMPNGNVWTCARSSATGSWYVNLLGGMLNFNSLSNRNQVLGASAS